VKDINVSRIRWAEPVRGFRATRVVGIVAKWELKDVLRWGWGLNSQHLGWCPCNSRSSKKSQTSINIHKFKKSKTLYTQNKSQSPLNPLKPPPPSWTYAQIIKQRGFLKVTI
jgi:hypothetical protein